MCVGASGRESHLHARAQDPQQRSTLQAQSPQGTNCFVCIFACASTADQVRNFAADTSPTTTSDHISNPARLPVRQKVRQKRASGSRSRVRRGGSSVSSQQPGTSCMYRLYRQGNIHNTPMKCCELWASQACALQTSFQGLERRSAVAMRCTMGYVGPCDQAAAVCRQEVLSVAFPRCG